MKSNFIKFISATITSFFIILLSANICCATPDISGCSAVLIEAETNRILYAKNHNAPLPMASTTKIITAITAIESENFDMAKVVEVSSSAAGVEGSSMYLENGEKITMGDLLYGLMLSSGNDAAVAISEALSQSHTVNDFVDTMNKKVSIIGAKNTQLTNPSGLPDDNHFSTAVDMAKITSYAIKNPVFSEIAATKNYRASSGSFVRNLKNHNKLLWQYDGCIGIKTGFTKSAGRCLVSAARKNDMTLICVTLNAPDDWNDHINLLNYGFSHYKMNQILNTNIPITSCDVVGSDGLPLSMVPIENLYYPMSDAENTSVEITVIPEISAPVLKGDITGEVSVTIPKNNFDADIQSLKIPLIAANDVNQSQNYNSSPYKSEGILAVIKAFFASWFDIL